VAVICRTGLATEDPHRAALRPRVSRMKEMQLRRFFDPLSFLSRAEAFLMRSEVENIVMLGLGGPPGAPSPPVLGEDCYLAVVEDAGEVVACALRVWPGRVLISRGKPDALEQLVDDLALKYTTLPGVHGPEPDVSRFAQFWSSRVGIPARLGMRLRLFQARTVKSLGVRPSGTLRVAEEADLPTIAKWARSFRSDPAPYNPADPHKEARQRVARRSVFVWDNGRPVSMAAWAGRTGRGVRVNFVYTPPECRRRGFASACVADLTQLLLTEGLAFCCLFTDLANPTSNSIYQRMGYRPVCDMSDFILNLA